MYELIQAGPRTYYVDCPSKIGVYVTGEGEACIIDSGNDKDAGKKVLKLLDEKGLKLKAIYNTHSHADHVGGNKLIQDRTGCSIYAPGLERVYAEHTILEPIMLYGSRPIKELTHKFFKAGESTVGELTDDVLPEGLEVIPLPGHSFDMCGYRTSDGVVFIADSLCSAETLEKYQIGFLYDTAQYLESLEKVKGLDAELFVPSHAEACRDIVPLADFNILKVRETADKICEICSCGSDVQAGAEGDMYASGSGAGRSFDDILAELFTFYGLTMNISQHALVGSTVKAYLSYLRDMGRIDTVIEDNRLLWKTKE